MKKRLLATIAFCATLNAAEPFLEKNNIFEAKKEGYAMYRIPGIVVTAKGTVLAYCEARRTGKSDWDMIDILLRRSTDGGKTWGARLNVAAVPGPKLKNRAALQHGKKVDAGDVTYNNPVAIPDRDGSVHFLFCLEYARCFYMRSDDDGVTFSDPVEITATFESYRPKYDWKVIATGPAHGVQLASGRLVVPIWLALGTESNGHKPSLNATIYSDDNGRTWRAGEIAMPDQTLTPNASETVIAQLADGTVMLNARTHAKTQRRAVTTSKDGISGWSVPRFDDALLEPVCMGSLVSHGPQRLLFANPHNLEKKGKNNRLNLSIKLSGDNGQTWPINRVLEPGNSAYSDLAVLPDGTILCLYERGGETDDDPATRSQYCYLTLARFNLEWLTQPDFRIENSTVLTSTGAYHWSQSRPAVIPGNPGASSPRRRSRNAAPTATATSISPRPPTARRPGARRNASTRSTASVSRTASSA